MQADSTKRPIIASREVGNNVPLTGTGDGLTKSISASAFTTSERAIIRIVSQRAVSCGFCQFSGSKSPEPRAESPSDDDVGSSTGCPPGPSRTPGWACQDLHQGQPVRFCLFPCIPSLCQGRLAKPVRLLPFWCFRWTRCWIFVRFRIPTF